MSNQEHLIVFLLICLTFAAIGRVQAKRKIKKLEDDLKDYKDFFLNNSVNCLNFINEDITVSYVKHDEVICRYVSGNKKGSILDFEVYGEVARVIKDNKNAKAKK